MVAVWRIVKLALKNKLIYFRDNSSLFLTMHCYLKLLIMLQTGCLVSPELSCDQPRWGRELVALLAFLVIVVWLFHTMPRVCLQLMIVVYSYNIFDARVVWSWTGSAEHRISINIAITCTMQHVNCIHIHVIDR